VAVNGEFLNGVTANEARTLRRLLAKLGDQRRIGALEHSS